METTGKGTCVKCGHRLRHPCSCGCEVRVLAPGPVPEDGLTARPKGCSGEVKKALRVSGGLSLSAVNDRGGDGPLVHRLDLSRFQRGR